MEYSRSKYKVLMATCMAQLCFLQPLSQQQEGPWDQYQQTSHQSLWTWKFWYPSLFSPLFYIPHLICSPGSIKRSCVSSSPSGKYSHTHTDSASSYLNQDGGDFHLQASDFPRYSGNFFNKYLDGCCKASACMRISSKKPNETVTPSLWRLFWIPVWLSLLEELLVEVRWGLFAPAAAFDLAGDNLILLGSEHKQPESDLGIALIS